MPPSKNNTKKESGRAKKAENEEKKAQAAQAAKEAKEAEAWKSGSKGVSKSEVAAAKQAELARKKAEREALLAAEEASTSTKKAAPKAGQKKKEKTLPPGGIIASSFSTHDPLGLRTAKGADGEPEKVPELTATGIEEMLEVMDLINEKTTKEAVGAKAGLIERHPERRFKAAFEAYLEREMPRIKDDHPGLRQNQYRDKLFKEFEKSPENPFNQAKVAYNATKEEKVEALRKVMDAREAKYKVEEQ
ncbi:hypothetical protein DB88DRAFT_341722 [Papiliotrema laurentii]|uniref:DUF1014-domain-containing protein n=1 Tax=Papiliotrema laurentii TaxID=5418 RepID=A0AAD9CYR7_PAPLA|nr:hypothetical protein DB88DRAFT_341722 [Papiliotrema laurentii]